MKRFQILLILAGLLITIILAFFLKDIIREEIIIPIAYMWWVLNLAYTAIPQILLWILLLAVLILVFITSLLKWYSMRHRYAEISRPAQGTVETLAGWLSYSGKGNYYKWMIANRLGKLWYEITSRSEDLNLSDPPDGQQSPGRVPVKDVQRYLKAGTEESFVDYPLPPLPFMHKKATPFDLDVDEVVDYLESQMEARNGKSHP